jgi:kinesin family protein 2/24
MFQRPTVPKQVSPSKPKTVARPPFLDELNREKKEDPIEKPTRYLNTYGVPLGQKQQQSKTSSASEAKSNPFIQDNTASTTCNLPQSSLNQRIRVCVRKRPLSKKEMTAKERDITSVIGNRTLQVNAPR